MKKEKIITDKAPAPIGPYNQAIRAGGMVFCSGQIALDAATGELAAEDVEGQTRKVMENVGEVLKAAGLGYDDVVKTTIFVKSMDDFAKVNEVYATFWGDVPPARSCVEAARLPKDVLVEVEAIALDK